MSMLTASEASVLNAPVTRREFLNYAFLASLGIFFVSLGGATALFALPRFGSGEFGGVFDLGQAGTAIPPTDAAPRAFSTSRVWISNTADGVLALYKVCPHLGCLYNWEALTNRFECPCHGSQYAKDGALLKGPAARGLDRFVIRFLDIEGKVVAETDATGAPLKIPGGNPEMVVDTSRVILGKP